jgi:hypothetical protein
MADSFTYVRHLASWPVIYSGVNPPNLQSVSHTNMSQNGRLYAQNGLDKAVFSVKIVEDKISAPSLLWPKWIFEKLIYQVHERKYRYAQAKTLYPVGGTLLCLSRPGRAKTGGNPD